MTVSNYVSKSASKSASKIAIVGLATQYPDADNPQTFWQNLLDKKDSRTQISREKLNANPADYQGVQGQSDRFYCDKGGYIQHFKFDARGYQLPESAFDGLDESFLWALDCSRKALQDAGIAPSDAVLARTGIVMGTLSFPTARSNELFLPLYHQTVEKALQNKLNQSAFQLADFGNSVNDLNANSQALNVANGAVAHTASKLVSDALGLGGTQLSLDAACASSVYALKLACDYLTTGKADMMLAGAVSGADPFFINMGFSIFHAYPDHGISAPFDSNSKGLFAGEGAGVLVLKRLEDAERDGDNIYAVVSGIGLSNDGKGQFVLSPNSKGQVQAFERAYSAANTLPANIEVIECHATGTPLGDKVELASMERFFEDKLAGSAVPLIGSAKSNLGHLLTAAGMPGIMKMIFAMRSGRLPPSINLSAPISSPKGLFSGKNLPTELHAWPDKAGNDRRHAGVSVFGFGGCNAHLLLESYVPANTSSKHQQSTAQVSYQHTPLNIIGLASHFGPLSSINALDNTISAKQDAFIPLPAKRWKGLDKHPEILANFGLPSVPQGAYIDQFDFDFLRFKVPPNEDDRLISQQLLLIKVADEAIRDANLMPGGKVAVLVAMETELELHQFRGRVNLHTQLADSLKKQGITLTQAEYLALEKIAMDSVLDAAKLNQYTSFIGNIMASRIASLWDFNGPAFTISAAEQSVARCIDVAENLLSQESLDAVVIAAVDLSGSLEQVILKNAVSPVAFTATDTGWKVGEGAGALVLTTAQSSIEVRNNDANAQSNSNSYGDSYGHISGQVFGPMCDPQGHSNAARICDDLLTQAKVNSSQISLIETSIAVEQLADSELVLNTLLPSVNQRSQAADTLGHNFAAAGMASILSALLQLKNQAQLNKHSSQAQQHALVATFSQGKCSQLLLSQSATQAYNLQQRLDQDLTLSEQKHLIKQVTLGGRDIYQHILDTPLAGLDAIQQKAQAMTALPARSQRKHLAQIASKDTNSFATSSPTTAQQKETLSSMPINALSTNKNATQAELKDAAFLSNQQLAREAHLAFLQSRAEGLKLADALMKAQLASELAVNGQAAPVQQQAIVQASATAVLPHPVLYPNHAKVPEYTPPTPISKPCIWDYADLVEYAEGDIAKVFGPDYAIIDSYSRRVRLPTTDYLLVSRVTKLNAQMNQYQPCTMTTEYDIPVDAPYLVDGQIPWAVAVESGQCDLMLISYLGIDFENKGERVYRLLDCTLTFLGDLPRGGDTLRYDISINHFARNGDTLLFFFSYECFVGDKLILKMDGGCAGFFTDKELADGKGVIHTEAEIKARNLALNNPNKPCFNPLLDCAQNQFDYSQIHKLLGADIGGCFGGAHAAHQAQYGLQPSLCFASEKFLMIEQVSNLEVHGGAWGLGSVQGHKQLEADHWYFPCHFKGDQVMAGSLMAEGCGQLLQFFMLHIGMHLGVKDGRFQPLENASQKVRCRGQVLPQSGLLTYRMEITEIGMSPRPYAKANIDILLNGKVVVDFQNLGVMIKEEAECTRYLADNHASTANNTTKNVAKNTASAAPLVSTPVSLAAPLMAQLPDLTAPTNKGVVPLKHVAAPIAPADSKYANRVPDTLPFTPYHMFEFATGDIENCFGPDFSIYRGLIPPRTPCGDLQLTTRVVAIDGKRGELKKPSSCIAEYEVPASAWYYDKNSHHAVMPYSVLMEISLQPNGFISGYMGTTLGFPGQELFFRNLDGNGKLLRHVDLRGKTIVNDSRLLSTVIAGSNIIQNFSFELSCDGEPFYQGKAVFGYFKGDALKNQLGIDNGKITQPWHVQNGIAADSQINLLDKQHRSFNAPEGQPHYRLAGGQLNFIDKAEIVKAGGKAGLGYLYAERTIDPSDWFFQFHFHQDPVMPGSLGVEAIIELMQTYAIDQDLGAGFKSPKFGQILSDIKWKYRGQINPLNKQMSLDVHITNVTDDNGKRIIMGDANLSKDGLRIYEVKDIAICIEEA
ncbi:3-hydroxyacyl-[acyl-carrier-protein] dehydratase FabA [Shewanella sp. JNE10-2]|nr:3-hydroxyacyl-[acyl-carrier-protein] dehydratase FabA [Shewanella sp. JNE9-1]MCK7632594.1 3-hydroxyacyl-[acyl-carrier-protein] dehydratase FabA [Shewanella sp. JNE17]MCK7643548.1 3-hydroxyacyl-[acyl-carrier-protein] dehydratase FabA [Shewanella sp. JNE3-1]MCK7648106.1 3-hydroxyacyl-[acyl-carrier-protein] dehydratase FabA [Shewanella sp. JNE8]MCK7651602.1 3-hydroxyacyl-[acyl-carrier-protein] dehydratase FabA [Shewanella sp. JNE4-1]MCK7655899.1 3-hydroxyacyl-[acyl-carrier-protein] dehydratase